MARGDLEWVDLVATSRARINWGLLSAERAITRVVLEVPEGAQIEVGLGVKRGHQDLREVWGII